MTRDQKSNQSVIGERVEHPQYGRGHIMAVYKSGGEWLVRFESGLRFRRPRGEFEGEGIAASPTPPPPTVSTPVTNAPVPAPMPQNQFEARALIEALRLGVAPVQKAQALTIGLEAERSSLVAGLNQAQMQGGAVRAVVGDYGGGKSHIVELSTQEALARGFLVASTSLDLLELPPHRAFNIYASLVQGLRYSDTDERGLGPLLERSSEKYLAGALADVAALEQDPLLLTLRALATTASSRQRLAWERWLEGGRRSKAMGSALKQVLPKGSRFPSLYKVGHNARQVAYLLSGLSVLAKLAGYSGLCVFIDEAESYSLLTAQQRPKAGLFFSAMIYAALQGRHPNLSEAEFPQHRFWDYPLLYGRPAALFFLFTVTRSDNRLPLEEWLQPEEILTLDPHPAPQEIAGFLRTLEGFHAQAYAYKPAERHGQVRRAAAEHLALGMRNHTFGVRGMVRLSVELYDLLYLHPEFEVAEMLGELRAQVR